MARDTDCLHKALGIFCILILSPVMKSLLSFANVFFFAENEPGMSHLFKFLIFVQVF